MTVIPGPASILASPPGGVSVVRKGVDSAAGGGQPATDLGNSCWWPVIPRLVTPALAPGV